MWTRNSPIPRNGTSPFRRSRPSRNQPFYHLYAETEATYYVAYVSERNLLPDISGEPLDHPEVVEMFGEFQDGRYPLQFGLN